VGLGVQNRSNVQWIVVNRCVCDPEAGAIRSQSSAQVGAVERKFVGGSYRSTTGGAGSNGDEYNGPWITPAWNAPHAFRAVSHRLGRVLSQFSGGPDLITGWRQRL
jgi:hypothetical protein